MKIIITLNDEGQLTDYQVKDGKASLDDLVNSFFNILDRATHRLLDEYPESLDELYEHYNGVFDLFLRRVFPEPPEGYFELSDAALLYAQDKLIADMEKKGITFKEALDSYEKKAQNYLKHKREGLA